MNSATRNSLIGLAMLVASSGVWSQDANGVNVIVVGSDGNGTISIKGSESDLDDLAKEMRAAFGGRIKNEAVLPLTELKEGTAFQQVSTVFAACDSNVVLLSAWIGPWMSAGSAGTSPKFLNVNEQALTADYVLNLIMFMPARTSFNFILAPGRYSFPNALLKNYERSAAGGGKHLIVVSALERMSYTAMIGNFVSAVKEMRETKQLDSNNDGQVSAGEWLVGLERKARNEKLLITPYWLQRGANIGILWVQK